MNNLINKRVNSLLYRRFIKLAIINSIIAIFWTLLFILPISLSQTLQRILVGGGPGVWLIIGYVLFILIGCLGFVGLSIIVLSINQLTRIMSFLLNIGMSMFYVGTLGSTLGLGIAGSLGGYSSTILHEPVSSTASILEPFVIPIQLFSLIAIIGALILMIVFLMVGIHENEQTRI
ncbi:MAG: hypothetical protein ACPL1B_06210 [Thermoprotei archaeon]|jgi:hypothetical protein